MLQAGARRYQLLCDNSVGPSDVAGELHSRALSIDPEHFAQSCVVLSRSASTLVLIHGCRWGFRPTHLRRRTATPCNNFPAQGHFSRTTNATFLGRTRLFHPTHSRMNRPPGDPPPYLVSTYHVCTISTLGLWNATANYEGYDQQRRNEHASLTPREEQPTHQVDPRDYGSFTISRRFLWEPTQLYGGKGKWAQQWTGRLPVLSRRMGRALPSLLHPVCARCRSDTRTGTAGR